MFMFIYLLWGWCECLCACLCTCYEGDVNVCVYAHVPIMRVMWMFMFMFMYLLWGWCECLCVYMYLLWGWCECLFLCLCTCCEGDVNVYVYIYVPVVRVMWMFMFMWSRIHSQKCSSAGGWTKISNSWKKSYRQRILTQSLLGTWKPGYTGVNLSPPPPPIKHMFDVQIWQMQN